MAENKRYIHVITVIFVTFTDRSVQNYLVKIEYIINGMCKFPLNEKNTSSEITSILRVSSR
jgi:hypothetical protein